MKNHIVSSDDVLKAFPWLKYLGGHALAFLFLWVLRIHKLNKIYKNAYTLPSTDFVNFITQELGYQYTIPEGDIKNIPAAGPFILIGNHPFGGAEAIICLKIMKDLRPDFKYMANFLLNQIQPLEPYFISVNPFETMRHLKSSYTGLKLSAEHIRKGNALGIFPAGEVSSYQKEKGEITDKKWPPSIMKFIKSQKVTVVPIYFAGRNSQLFYLLGSIHPLLRTAKLASELLNKKNQLIKIRIGKPISLKEQQKYENIQEYTQFLRDTTYALFEKKS